MSTESKAEWTAEFNLESMHRVVAQSFLQQQQLERQYRQLTDCLESHSQPTVSSDTSRANTANTWFSALTTDASLKTTDTGMIRELSHWTTTVHSIHDALKSLGHLQSWVDHIQSELQCFVDCLEQAAAKDDPDDQPETDETAPAQS